MNGVRVVTKIFLMVLGAALFELVAGQEGHLLEIHGVAARSILFLVVMAVTGIYFLVVRNNDARQQLSAALVLPIALFGFALVGALVGWRSGAPRAAVQAELAGYAFIFYLLPLGLAWAELKKNKNKFLVVAAGGLILTALITLVLFLIFSWHGAEIHGPLYKWWRDVAFGKITDTGTAFFRITSAAHLWFVATFFVGLVQLLREKVEQKFIWWSVVIVSVLILIINFSRAYLLGIIFGILVLASHKFLLLARTGPGWKNFFSQYRQAKKNPFSRVLCVLTVIVLMFVSIFISLNLIASKGRSIGTELLLSRTKSIVNPLSETSTRLRSEILSSVIARIKTHPLRGNGLGDVITFWSPSAQKNITTNSFDWGYLQTWNQLGLGGLIFLLWIIGSLLWRSGPLVKSITAAYAITHIFGPTFFHPIGLAVLALLWVVRYYEPEL